MTAARKTTASPSGAPAPASRRPYDASRRRQAAADRRRRILEAARELFVRQGYAATTVSAIAELAGAAPDTVYTSVGSKATVFGELVELALSGADTPVVGAERDYAVRIRAEQDPARKLRIYADAVTELQGRLAPLFTVLREAAPAEPRLGALWQGITERRARNMRQLAADVGATGALRKDLTLDEVADVIWTMNSAEYYTALVVERGWAPHRFADWLHDAWCRLLLA